MRHDGEDIDALMPVGVRDLHRQTGDVRRRERRHARVERREEREHLQPDLRRGTHERVLRERVKLVTDGTIAARQRQRARSAERPSSTE